MTDIDDLIAALGSGAPVVIPTDTVYGVAADLAAAGAVQKLFDLKGRPADKPVSVLGAVQKPGSLSISGRWTLVNAITAAGGLTATAGHKIYVLRRADNGLSDTLESITDAFFTVDREMRL
ncbi:MAG: Sua5/YciO/YrdC/YwlC family protein, partial [Actinomycetota bacterium]